MKRIFKFLGISSLTIAFIFLLMLCAFAAEINSNPANVGDTVTYELHVKSCPNKIQALDVTIYYDSNSLELVPYSLELPSISGFMTNTEINGEIRFNAMDFEGFSFEEDKILSTVQFTVKDTTAQNLNLSYEIKTFLDSNNIDVKDTYVYDLTAVNGGVDKAFQNDTDLNITTDSDILTDIISTDSEKNLDNDTAKSDETEEIMPKIDSNIDNNLNNVSNSNYPGNTFSSSFSSRSQSGGISFSSQNSSANNSENARLYIIVLAVAAVIILAIGIVFVIVTKRSNQGSHFS